AARQRARPFRAWIFVLAGADENVRIENHPHPALGSTSFCACLIRRSMSSSVRPAAMTRARDARRPGISSSGSIVLVTRSSGSRPRLASNLADSGFDHFALGRHWPNSSCWNLGRPGPLVKFTGVSLRAALYSIEMGSALSSSRATSVIHLERRAVLGARLAVIVDAGGGDVSVAEPILNFGDVVLAVERIGGGRRTQRMGRRSRN